MKPIDVELPFAVPNSLVLSNLAWTWRDLSGGISAGFCSPELAVDGAISLLSLDEKVPADVLELAGCSPSDPDVLKILSRLVEKERAILTDEEERSRWLYVVLLAAYKLRTSLGDPLRVVEDIYASFDYPEELAPFVRYMPSDQPDLGSREKNEERLIRKWGEYLQRAAKRFGRGA